MAKLKTGRHTSSLKEARKSKKRADRNATVKSEIKTAVKRVEAAVKAKDLKLAQETLKQLFSKWDKAAKRNVVHYKAAANQKARLSKKVSAIKEL
ncbi:MAG: 30S ribosomal protein S20 [Elusimicrobiota bacterium]|jgi:small subunit ribosomal protein S20|nr:30S ribosomal protein S20 [Elusimicrobiota bacterium]